MYKIVVEFRKAEYDDPDVREYNFYQQTIAIKDYVDWCILLKGYEYIGMTQNFTDVFLKYDNEIIDHRYFIEGRYV